MYNGIINPFETPVLNPELIPEPLNINCVSGCEIKNPNITYLCIDCDCNGYILDLEWANVGFAYNVYIQGGCFQYQTQTEINQLCIDCIPKTVCNLSICIKATCGGDCYTNGETYETISNTTIPMICGGPNVYNFKRDCNGITVLWNCVKNAYYYDVYLNRGNLQKSFQTDCTETYIPIPQECNSKDGILYINIVAQGECKTISSQTSIQV